MLVHARLYPSHGVADHAGCDHFVEEQLRDWKESETETTANKITVGETGTQVLDHGHKDGRLSSSARFVTTWSPISLLSSAIHLWVELNRANSSAVDRNNLCDSASFQ
jgi:hypothetical protein